MNICEIIDGILSTFKVPFYHEMPEFAREPPPRFIVYSFYDVPAFFGCGQEQVTRYHVTFNIYTTGTNFKSQADQISRDLTALLLENDFVRQSGSCSLSNDFPKYYHRIIEFIYDYEN